MMTEHSAAIEIKKQQQLLYIMLMLIRLCFFCIQSEQQKLILPQTFSCGVTEYFPQDKERNN